MRSAGSFPAEAAWTGPAGGPLDIFDAAVPMALIGEDGTILEANREFCGLAGLDERELNGRHASGVISGLSYTGGRPSKGRGSLVAKGGQMVPVAYSLSSHSGRSLLTALPRVEEARLAAELEAKEDELKKREHYIECFRDGVFRMIIDLDRSESELKETLKELQEAQVQLVQSCKMTALGELAASLVHEISQPLTVIRGLTHGMLRTMNEDSQCRDKMRLIGDAATRMEKIVKHLKSFSRAEPPVFTPVDLNAVIRDAFLILNEHLLSHSIETVLDLSHIPPVMGNPNRIEQVVINLVSNARDAMPDGGVLSVSTVKDEENGKPVVRLTVRDSGCGIPREVLARVFEPFFTTKASGKGTGLGLSISLSIVREHMGEIKVESTAGQGTSFHVILPAMACG